MKKFYIMTAILTTLNGLNSAGVPAEVKPEIIFDRPGGYPVPMAIGGDILEQLADLKPGEDRFFVANQTSIKPALEALKALYNSGEYFITLDTVKSRFDFNDPNVKGLMIVLASALRFKKTHVLENTNIVIDINGINGFKTTASEANFFQAFHEVKAVRNAGNVTSETVVSWDKLNELCKALTGKDEEIFNPVEMNEIFRQFSEKSEAEKANAVTSAAPLSTALVKNDKFDFQNPSGGFTRIELTDQEIEKRLADLIPNANRHMVGNRFGLTPAKKFIEKYISLPDHEIPNFDKIKMDTDFVGFMVTVAAYFRYMKLGNVENTNVFTDTTNEQFYGYNGNNRDPNSYVKWGQMLEVFKKIKKVASR